MIFEDRFQAGELLAEKLSKLKLNPKKSTVFAIPRGGMVVGKAIAEQLGIPLRAIVIKKLGSPFNAELAIGATASFGKPVLDEWLIRDLGVSREYIKKEGTTKKKEAKAREKFLQAEINPDDFKGQTLIVVDDGLATGQTARAAAKVLRTLSPKALILAVPCAAPQSLEAVSGDFDKIICLEANADFMAVGQFYSDFRPVEDSEVKDLLSKVS